MKRVLRLQFVGGGMRLTATGFHSAEILPAVGPQPPADYLLQEVIPLMAGVWLVWAGSWWLKGVARRPQGVHDEGEKTHA